MTVAHRQTSTHVDVRCRKSTSVDESRRTSTNVEARRGDVDERRRTSIYVHARGRMWTHDVVALRGGKYMNVNAHE